MDKKKLLCGTCLIIGLLLGIIAGTFLGFYSSAMQMSNLLDNVHIDAVNIKFNSTEILNAVMPVLNESSAQTCAKLGYKVD